MSHKDGLDNLIRHVLNSARLLLSPRSRFLLRGLDGDTAAVLRGAILAIAGFLDDSISNPRLGSLFEPYSDSPLNRMRRYIAETYRVMETIPGTNGTTALNVPAVMSLAGEGQLIAVGRDSHVSIPAGVALSGTRPVYIVPPFNAELGILLPPSPSEVRAVLDSHPDLKAVVLTLPSYHGVQGNVMQIVDDCHARGLPLMIDEAHGPHYWPLRALGFPLSAEEAGADVITQSIHKVMSALNQGSVIHFNNRGLLTRYLEAQSLGFVSTSFSFAILDSIEHAISQIVARGVEMWGMATKFACRLRETASGISGVHALDENIVDGDRVLGLDPTRVTFNVREAGLSGFDIAEKLSRVSGFVEMATPDVILFLVSPGVTEAEADITMRALKHALKAGARSTRLAPFVPPPLPEQVLTPRCALMRAPRERVPVGSAVGRVSAETIGCYPPGQAIVVAGERVTEGVVDYLTRAVDAGAHLKRVYDDHFQTIEVVRNEAVSIRSA